MGGGPGLAPWVPDHSVSLRRWDSMLASGLISWNSWHSCFSGRQHLYCTSFYCLHFCWQFGDFFIPWKRRFWLPTPPNFAWHTVEQRILTAPPKLTNPVIKYKSHKLSKIGECHFLKVIPLLIKTKVELTLLAFVPSFNIELFHYPTVVTVLQCLHCN